MQVQFKQLGELVITHNYFRSGIDEDLEIVPTPLCMTRLNKNGLLFRKTPSGFKMLYEAVDDGQGGIQPLKPIEGRLKFSFTLVSKNPYLVNYSRLPFESGGGIYHLHNLNKDETAEVVPLVSDEASGFMSSQDRIELKPHRFQHRFESPAPSVLVEIQDELGNQVKSETVAVVEGSCNYAVDLQGNSPGRYTLKTDGVAGLKFYADEELIGKRILGVIELSLNDMAEKKYGIGIDSRKTYWKYYMVLKYRLKDCKTEEWPADWVEKWPAVRPDDWPEEWPDSWKVVYPADQSVNILPMNEELKVLPDGTIAIPFVSDKELPLRQDPVKNIKLTKTGGNGTAGGIREKELPNPTVRNIKPPRKGDQDISIYSEMYVYL